MKRIFAVLAMLVCVIGGITGILLLGNDEGDDVSTKKVQDAAGGDHGITEISSKESVNTEKKPVDTTETTEDAVSELVDKTMAEMSLHDKVCQMMFVTPEGLTGTDDVMVAGDATKQALQAYPVGGIIYFANNFDNVDQTRDMISNTQSYSKIGLFIATDEEGGRVNRIMDTLGTTYIGPMYDYKDDGSDAAFENAKTIASDMSALGFNLDFAPVADVWSNPDNTVIGDRAYSDDYAQAAELVGSAVKGFQDGGVICTLKHFPGHGDTAEDSHYSSAYVNRTKAQIMADEMQPFRTGIDAGAELVMVGHLIVPDIDELPSTLSYKIATEMLRGDMEFDGVAITDSMEMESIADNYGVADSAVMAVQAGMDMLLQPADLAAAVNAIVTAVQNGDITEPRIDESVRRILTLKAERGLLE
ncbi:glycoside hydrolase family 3 protein [Coprococcus eutactus]|uniref:glycoside hydrolase family 3 protein n=1 Tax=Coprococcus eutactus TaxID=33043 RepID=UPI00321B1EDF